MADQTKCPTCERREASSEIRDDGLYLVFPRAVCTGRPGCVRAAGTEGGAWDYPEEDDELVRGLRDRAFKRAGGNPQVGAPHTRTVEWRGAEEITRLRAEVERLRLACGEYDEELNGREAEAARAARDREVAEAVREAASRVFDDFAREAWARHEARIGSAVEALGRRVRDIDLDDVIASIAKEAQG